MSMRQITVVSYGKASIQDFSPIDGSTEDALSSVTLDGTPAVPVTTVFTVTEREFTTSVRKQLQRLAAKRLRRISGASVLTKTQPLLTWTSERVPGGRPRLHQLEGAPSAGTATSQTFVARGEGLIPGVTAAKSVGTGTAKLTLTAVRKGPSGNNISVVIAAAKGAGSVTPVFAEDGVLTVTVVPAAGSSNANAIAAQINGDTTTALFVGAVGGGAGTVIPQTIKLEGGDGCGIAFAVLPSAVAGSYLLVEAQLPGNTQNLLTVTTSTASGGGSVSVSGTNITIVPAAASNTITAVVAQIAANASAKVLIKGTVIGNGASAWQATTKTYLAGGAGETPVLKLAGVAVNVSKFTDTEIDFDQTGAILVAGGMAAGEVAEFTMLTDFGLTSMSVAVGA